MPSWPSSSRGGSGAALSKEEITIFDSTGTALEDVAAAVVVYEKAVAGGVGSAVDLGAWEMDSRLLAFVVIAASMTVTPGADMALVTRPVLFDGRRAALLTTLGICLGCLVHATASAFGLSVILSRSAAAFQTVKLLGAGYLVLLGVQALREAAIPESWNPTVRRVRADRVLLHVRYFLDGFLTNLLEPQGRALLPHVPASVRARRGAGT